MTEVPITGFELEEGIDAVSFSGTFAGTFFLDDVRLVASSSQPTPMEEEYTSQVPQSFALDQNFPNPFNSSTAIRYSLPAGADVTLTVFNLLGQKVVTLAQGPRDAGLHEVRWNGRDHAKRALASGVYLYTLRTDYRLLTRRLLLLQ